MTLFFVRDSRHRYRFFSAEPATAPSVHWSRARKALEVAKEKLMLLPQRTLRQEQAFAKAPKGAKGPVRILHSGLLDPNHIKRKFRIFLHKQRTLHLLILIGETLLLPLAGLCGFLPGPNVAFYSLALLMILQWRAFRGIRRIFRHDWDFRHDRLLAEWEKAVEQGRQDNFPKLLEKIEIAHEVKKARKILWRTSKPQRRNKRQRII